MAPILGGALAGCLSPRGDLKKAAALQQQISPAPATRRQVDRQGPALEAMVQRLLWLSPSIEKFPRFHKFTLGDRIKTTALDALERPIEATFTRQRRTLLQQANLDLQKLRILLRLAHELGHLDARRDELVMRRIDDVGRLVGGWMKSAEPLRDASAALERFVRPHGAVRRDLRQRPTLLLRHTMSAQNCTYREQSPIGLKNAKPRQG